jgi:hypothetical protein
MVKMNMGNILNFVFRIHLISSYPLAFYLNGYAEDFMTGVFKGAGDDNPT